MAVFKGRIAMFRSCALAAVVVLLVSRVLPGNSATPKRILAGTLVDGEDRRVESADVWLTGTSSAGEAAIFGHAQSDSRGQFRIEVPPEWFACSPAGVDRRAIFAWRPGMRLAVHLTGQRLIPSPETVRLVLEPATSEPVVVRGPQGESIDGARLSIVSLFVDDWGAVRLPEELREKFATRTDADGRASIAAVSMEQVFRLAVESARFGTQHRPVPPHGAWKQGITLRSAGRLRGRVTAADPELAAGLRIAVTTYEFSESGGELAHGLADVTTGADGRFEVPAIMHGVLVTQVHVPAQVPFRARTTQTQHAFKRLSDATDWAVSGEVTEVEIPLERAVHVSGVVRERGSEQSISGVAVGLVHRGGWRDVVVTDAQGRYESHVLPPGVTVAASAPVDYLPARQDEALSIDDIAEDAERVDVPPIELTGAVVVRGRVVDERGEPVAGACVEVRLMSRDVDDWADVEVLADGKGEFRVEGADPEGQVRLKAHLGDAVIERPILRRANEGEPVTLTISPDHRMALRGRAVDPGGEPIVEANVVIWRRTFPRRQVHEEALGFEEELRTDAEGRFETPRTLERDGLYRAVISGNALRSTETDWLHVAGEDKTTFPDAIVARLLPFAGDVVDRQGGPVPQATVTFLDDRERHKATTDDEGRFHFESVPTGKSFLLIEKPGFRFAGRLVDAADPSASVQLVRRDEEPQASLRTLPQALPRERRFALARRLVEPVLAKSGQADPGIMHRACEVLAAIDPEGMLQRIDDKPFADAQLNAAVRMTIAQRLLSKDPEEALLVAESIETPIWRIKVYLDACDALPDTSRQRKLELLGEAIVYARGTENPSFRAIGFGFIGERLLDLGETRRATEILREGHTIARELPAVGFGGYARGAFAEELAQIDVDAALELAGRLEGDSEFNRHHGNIAHELGAKNPAQAERVLGMLRAEDAARYLVSPHDQYAVRVCYRMATVDLERATRIADAAQNAHQRGYIYGTMALALAETNKQAATNLLRRAFAILQAAVDGGEDRFNYLYSASTIAARLLPAAEQIDPPLVPEFLWRTVSFRLLPTDDVNETQLANQSNAILAVLLARYDRDVARALMAPLGPSGDSRDPWLRAAAILDPERAVEQVEQMDESDDGFRRLKTAARLRVANTLALDGDELWRAAAQDTALWVPDTEDL